ncbi:hypothetical protein GVAV_001699 [Gurleya vavrai]
MEINMCFIFNEKAFKEITELNEKEPILGTEPKGKINFTKPCEISALIPDCFFTKANEKQLFTRQKKPFCVFIQNLFFAYHLNENVDLYKFDLAFYNARPYKKQATIGDKMREIKYEVEEIFIFQENEKIDITKY